MVGPRGLVWRGPGLLGCPWCQVLSGQRLTGTFLVCWSDRSNAGPCEAHCSSGQAEGLLRSRADPNPGHVGSWLYPHRLLAPSPALSLPLSCKWMVGVLRGVLTHDHHHLQQTEKLPLTAPRLWAPMISSLRLNLALSGVPGALVLAWGHSRGVTKNSSRVLRSGRQRGLD